VCPLPIKTYFFNQLKLELTKEFQLKDLRKIFDQKKSKLKKTFQHFSTYISNFRKGWRGQKFSFCLLLMQIHFSFFFFTLTLLLLSTKGRKKIQQ